MTDELKKLHDAMVEATSAFIVAASMHAAKIGDYEIQTRFSEAYQAVIVASIQYAIAVTVAERGTKKEAAP